jgi:hypothetical protein
MFVRWCVAITSASVYREGRVETVRRGSHLGYLMASCTYLLVKLDRGGKGLSTVVRHTEGR